jgi:hypothetical protein
MVVMAAEFVAGAILAQAGIIQDNFLTTTPHAFQVVSPNARH